VNTHAFFMSEDRLHIDFESRSRLDLTKVGTVIYANEPSTSCWCFAWAFNHEKVALWEPGQPIPRRIIEHIASGGTVSGFSVQFEYHCWNIILPRQLGIELPPMTYQQLDCTQARAVVMGLPRNLDALAGALDQKHHRMQKDAAGRRLMLQMARPRYVGPDGSVTWWDDPDRRHRLGLYCMQDVEVERWSEHFLRPLTPTHRQYWEMDFRMNFIRGIQIDTHLVEQSRDLLELAAKGANKLLRKITGGKCTGIAQIQGLRDWLASEGVETPSLDKEHLQALLDSEHVEGKARAALQLRQDFGKASLAKIAQFIRRTADGRMHGLLLFNGAGPGRWTGQGAQLHNLPRPELEANFVEYVVQILRNTEYTAQNKYDLLEMVFGAVLPPMADAIRGFIVAKPKHKLFVRDFSNIEGRCIARMAGEQWKLDAFAAFDAGRGPDLYKLAVARAFGIPVEEVTDRLRQLGKTMELSLGYAGGSPALVKQARKYGINLADYYEVVSQSVSRAAVSKAEWGWSVFGFKTGIKERTWLTAEMLKLAWRETNPAIVAFWDKLDEAAICAVREPKKVFSYRGISFQLGKIKGIPYLMCQLPSGRLLYYPYATWTELTTPWGAQRESVRFMGINPNTHKWSSSHGRGGLWAENITQGDSFDFIAAAMLRCENAGFPPVLSVHDENVAEAPETADDALYGRLMAQRPPWARGMPLAVAGFSGPRYAKK
jgi:DNA polymerase